jgi:hypothetical protein
LRPYARDEEEADQQQDRERSQFTDQQEPSGVEVLMAKRIKVKNSLVGNINKRRKLGISRPKSESTVDPRQYQQMKKGWK